MNNHDENKKYFKSTFKVFHAPDNTAKEVLNMAKKLNQEDSTKNTIQKTVNYQAESVPHHNFGKWIAVACACVLIVGSGVYFNNLNSENVSNQLEDNDMSIGLSTQVDTVEDITYTNFIGKFNPTGDIAISYQYKDENNNIIQNLEKSKLTSNEIDLINNAIDLNTCTKIDENTFYEHNPKYNEDLLNSDINLDNASIEFTDGNKLFNIYIVNDVMVITYFTSNDETRLYNGYYSIEDTRLLDTIRDILSGASNNGGSLIQYSPNIDTATAEIIHCDGDTIYTELSTNSLISINNVVGNTIIWSEMSKQDYQEWTSKSYNDYISVKVQHNNDGRETEYLIYQHCVIMLEDDYIGISTAITGNQFGTILNIISNVPILNDINFILNDLIPNSVAITDKNGTLTEYSATENYDLSEINDILQAQEWSLEPTQERNQENAIIFCTDYTYNQDDNNIFIGNTSYVVLYQDSSLAIINDNGGGTLYSKNGSELYDTIYNTLKNMQYVEFKTLSNEDNSQQVATLFGAVEIPINSTVYYSTSSDDLHYNIEMEHYTNGLEFNGTLNAQAIQKINELSNITLWTKTDEPPYAGQSVIFINLNDSYSGYGCSFAIYDNGIAITYEDNTEEYYIVDNNLIQQLISVIDEYAEPNTFRTDSHNLFGIIPMDENTTINGVIDYYYTGRENNACILNYLDLLKINELSCYNTWQKLNSNPITQDFSYQTAVSLKNDNYSIQILDTTIIVTYPDGTVEYYSTMETCGTFTFAQRVLYIIDERSKTQIID